MKASGKHLRRVHTDSGGRGVEVPGSGGQPSWQPADPVCCLDTWPPDKGYDQHAKDDYMYILGENTLVER